MKLNKISVVKLISQEFIININNSIIQYGYCDIRDLNFVNIFLNIILWHMRNLAALYQVELGVEGCEEFPQCNKILLDNWSMIRFFNQSVLRIVFVIKISIENRVHRDSWKSGMTICTTKPLFFHIFFIDKFVKKN